MSVDTHYEKGKALVEQGEYEAALEAFNDSLQEEEETPQLWNSIGSVFAQMKDFEEAIDSYDNAIVLDDEYAEPWYGKGLVYQETGNTELALKALDGSIIRNRQWAAPWLAKGILLLSTGKMEDGARCMHHFEYLGGAQAAANCFAVFSQLPPYPFFSYRIIQDYMLPWEYPQWKEYLNTSLEEALPLKAYLWWLEHHGNNAGLSDDGWQQFLGHAHYWMGDPAMALHHFSNSQETGGSLSLKTAYYQIQACWDLYQPDTTYLKPALEAAESYLPPEQPSWQFWKKQEALPPLSGQEVEECYYAGLIFIDHDELDKALRCLERIEEQFLPAAYMAMWVCEEMVTPKKKKQKADALLIREEQEQQWVNGLSSTSLALQGEHNAILPFLKAFRYLELADAIERLHYYVEFEDGELEVQNPKEQLHFFELWELPSTAEQAIDALVRDNLSLRCRQALLEEKPDASSSDSWNALLEELGAIKEEEALTAAIAETIREGQFPNEEYLLLTTHCYATHQLSTESKQLLDFYAFFRSGEKEVEKINIQNAIQSGQPFGGGIGMGSFARGSELPWPSAIPATAYEETLEAGTFAHRLLQYCEGEEAHFSSFEQFRMGFTAFREAMPEDEEE